MSCLQAIEDKDTENPLICHIMNLLWALRHKSTHVRICWVPSICGIEGNEIVVQILVKTAPLQNGHTQNGHKTFCYQNGHNQNVHTAFGQNGHRERITTKTVTMHLVKTATEDRGRITTKTATLHLVKTATEGGSPDRITNKTTTLVKWLQHESLPKRPHYRPLARQQSRMRVCLLTSLNHIQGPISPTTFPS